MDLRKVETELDLARRSVGVSIATAHTAHFQDVLGELNAVWAWRWRHGADVPFESPSYVQNPIARQMADILLSHPFFYRLNFCRQLGTQGFWSNLGATHSRLAHCYGTLSIAAEMVEAVERRAATLRDQMHDAPEEIPPEVSLATLLYAFLHDSIPLPYGHTLDLVKDFFIPNDPDAIHRLGFRRKLDKYFLSTSVRDWNSEDSQNKWLYNPLAMALEDLLPELLALFHIRDCVSAREEIRRAILWLSLPKGLLDTDLTKWSFLRQIVDSRLDADRLDWIFRDYMHLNGENLVLGGEAPKNAIRRVVDAIRITTNPDNGDEWIIAFASDEEQLIADFLQQRVDMYAKYYEASQKLATDEMVAHAIWATVDHGLLTLNSDNPKDIDREVKNRVAILTDHQAHELVALTGPPYARHLLNHAVSARPFVELWSYDAEIDERVLQKAKDFRRNFSNILKEFEDPKEGLPRGFSRTRQGWERAFKTANKSVNYDSLGLSGKLYLFVHVAHGGVLEKLAFENRLWSALLKEPDFSRWWANYAIRAESTDVSEDPSYGALLRRWPRPYIFLSLPYYSARQVEELEEPREDEVEETIYVLDERENRVRKLTRGSHTLTKVSVRIYGPAELRDIAGKPEIEKLVRNTFVTQILDDLQWIERLR